MCYTVVMKILTELQIENAVYEIAKKMCFEVDEKTLKKISDAYEKEDNRATKDALSDIIVNAKIAKNEHIPLCQDTGIVIAFCEIGGQIVIDGSFEKAVNSGIKRAYSTEYLRKSVVKSPLDRVNTNDNTPCIIHTTITDGDKLKITLCPKGAGSENMGRVKMLTPASGEDGIIDFVVETVRLAGGKACPPLIVGVGIGGDLEECALLSKRALLRDIDDCSKDTHAKRLEDILYEKINSLNIGAMGLKGKTTCLAVKVETFPCHIASLPVAVSLMCHANRHATCEL